MKEEQLPGDRGDSPERTDDPGKDYRRSVGIPVIPALDGFRAFAILGIVFLHTVGISSTVSGSELRTVFYGTLPNLIQVLFVISGFVVFLPTVVRGGEFGSVGSYALRRAARLVPAYWLVIGIVLLLLAVWPWPGMGMPGLGEVLAHLSMIQVPMAMLSESFDIGLIIDGPLWTLSLEATFYVLLPLIAGVYFRHPLLGLAVAAAITIGWKTGFQHIGALTSAVGIDLDAADQLLYTRRGDNQFPAYAFAFGAGMTAAWAYARLPQLYPEALLRRRAMIAQLISLAALAFFAYKIGHYAVITDNPRPHAIALRSPWIAIGFAGSLAAFMLATTLAPRRLQMPFALPFARGLGDVSYGMYLIHSPLLFFFWALILQESTPLGGLPMFWALMLTAFPLTILYGFLSARVVEQPIRRWAHRFGRRAQEAEPGPAPAAAPAAVSGR